MTSTTVTENKQSGSPYFDDIAYAAQHGFRPYRDISADKIIQAFSMPTVGVAEMPFNTSLVSMHRLYVIADQHEVVCISLYNYSYNDGQISNPLPVILVEELGKLEKSSSIIQKHIADGFNINKDKLGKIVVEPELKRTLEELKNLEHRNAELPKLFPEHVVSQLQFDGCMPFKGKEVIRDLQYGDYPLLIGQRSILSVSYQPEKGTMSISYAIETTDEPYLFLRVRNKNKSVPLLDGDAHIFDPNVNYLQICFPNKYPIAECAGKTGIVTLTIPDNSK